MACSAVVADSPALVVGINGVVGCSVEVALEVELDGAFSGLVEVESAGIVACSAVVVDCLALVVGMDGTEGGSKKVALGAEPDNWASYCSIDVESVSLVEQDGLVSSLLSLIMSALR